MIPFKDYKKECLFRNDKLCSYWQKTTECHLLSCPFYSSDTTTEQKRLFLKRKQDMVTFSPDDLDKVGNTIQDIISKTRKDDGLEDDEDQYQPQRSTVTEKLVSRLTCLACGEQIFDDKFTTIRDPHGVVIYLHSKGKCEIRHEQMPIVRERWLEMHKSIDEISDLEEME